MSKPQLNRYPWIKVGAAFFGGLVYGVSPIDLIPDLIPLLGLSDDVALWATILVYALVQRAKVKRESQKEIAAPVR